MLYTDSECVKIKSGILLNTSHITLYNTNGFGPQYQRTWESKMQNKS